MNASDRLQVLQQQLSSSSNSSSNATSIKSPNDIVIVSAVRTPICRARKGGFKDSLPEELLSVVLKAVVERVGLDKKLVDDIIVGNVLPPAGGATVARMAMLHAGFPEKTSIATVNRQCASGLQAVASIAAAIQAGQVDIGIGAGVESMTTGYGPSAVPPPSSDAILAVQAASDALLPMGETSENVASDYRISRERQDQFSVASHQKAFAAQKAGKFDSEIVPVTLSNGQIIKQDDGIRGDTTLAGLSQLKPAFRPNGTTTAGNASQVSDGAAAVLLMKRSTAQKLRLPILAVFRSFASIGVPPRIMGVGPALAIPVALQKAGITKDKVDVFELNEAFASQAVYCIDALKLDIAKVNPNGGAIALGHPLGATGARQIATLLPELKRRRARFGVVSMCIGSGMGAAAVIELD